MQAVVDHKLNRNYWDHAAVWDVWRGEAWRLTGYIQYRCTPRAFPYGEAMARRVPQAQGGTHLQPPPATGAPHKVWAKHSNQHSLHFCLKCHTDLQPEQHLGKELQTFSTGKTTAGGAANHKADTWTESDHQKSGNSDLQTEVKGMQNTQRRQGY